MGVERQQSIRLPPTLPPNVAVDMTFRSRSFSIVKTALPPLPPNGNSTVAAEEKLDDEVKAEPEMELQEAVAEEVKEVRMEIPDLQDLVKPEDERTELNGLKSDTPAPTCIHGVDLGTSLIDQFKGSNPKILKPLQFRVVEFPNAKVPPKRIPVDSTESLQFARMGSMKQYAMSSKDEDMNPAREARRRICEVQQLLEVMWETNYMARQKISIPQTKSHPVALLDINLALERPPLKTMEIEPASELNSSLPPICPLPGIGIDVLRRQIWCPPEAAIPFVPGQEVSKRRLFSASKIWKDTSARTKMQLSAIQTGSKEKERDSKKAMDILQKEVADNSAATADSAVLLADKPPLEKSSSSASIGKRKRKRYITSARFSRPPVVMRQFSAIRGLDVPKSSKPKVGVYVKTESGRVNYVPQKHSHRLQPPVPKKVGRSMSDIMTEMNSVLNNLVFVQPDTFDGNLDNRRSKRNQNGGSNQRMEMPSRHRTRVPRYTELQRKRRKEDSTDPTPNPGSHDDNSDVAANATKPPKKVSVSHKQSKKLRHQARTDYDYYHLHKEDYCEPLHMNEVELARPPQSTKHLTMRTGNVVEYTTDGWADMHEITTPERSKLFYVQSDQVTIRPATTPCTPLEHEDPFFIFSRRAFTPHGTRRPDKTPSRLAMASSGTDPGWRPNTTIVQPHPEKPGTHSKESEPIIELGGDGFGLSGAHLRVMDQAEVLPPPPTRRREVAKIIEAVDKKYAKKRKTYQPKPRHAVLRSKGLMEPTEFEETVKAPKRVSTAVKIDYLTQKREQSKEKQLRRQQKKTPPRGSDANGNAGGGDAASKASLDHSDGRESQLSDRSKDSEKDSSHTSGRDSGRAGARGRRGTETRVGFGALRGDGHGEDSHGDHAGEETVWSGAMATWTGGNGERKDGKRRRRSDFRGVVEQAKDQEVAEPPKVTPPEQKIKFI
ncbi:hypothetical protein HDU97_008001 [Phlyctochytrium planicorne]|nr:hypothetical protein HDU97_008001 [Phlyctochytrium planicorne]